ncbi:regulatory iron-sulfur-containing complex subunit RicT [Streptococcus didelphis]|uniref:regulatory iron-sulfur-containing complex subunit RicT n=1 Tax=Streptococcus didelphis TaxID=102886 RepID=UPI00036201A8|nr:regulatory iron-sulfur-containing complex subunit RicT [Streptococcus didelphis]
MTSTIGIKYSEKETIQFVKSDQDYPKMTYLVIKEARGSRLARVYQPLRELREAALPKDIPSVVRQATARDIKVARANQQFAQESRMKVKELITARQLDMSLIDIIFPLEKNYVLITFTAEERVDFRLLLKDLAGFFKMRIELRQLNSREEAKVYGGLGPCGRPTCCSSFLGEFPAVSIKMLKNQGLSFNSEKTRGYCGRLLCCLQYEDSFYQESKGKFPDYGSIVETSEGQASVVSIDIFKEEIKVRPHGSHLLRTYHLEEVSLGK